MRRSKRVASMVAVIPFAAMMWACGGAEPPANTAPTPATNKAPVPSNANSANVNAAPASNTNAASAAMTIPADVKPIFTAKCAGCHGADATGGPAAPSICKVKDKHTTDEWIKYLKDPKSLDKDSKMPPVSGTDAELKTVASWLSEATGHDSMAK